MSKTEKSAEPRHKAAGEFEWELRLYVAGQTPHSIAALNNLRQLCETHLKGRSQGEWNLLSG